MKQFMRNTLLLVCTVFALASCHFNSEYLNREEDKKDAEKITNKLFELIKAKNYEATTSLFSKRFYEVSNKSKLLEIFAATNNKLGELKDTKIESWQTKRVEGSNPSATYLFIYQNKYEKFESKEKITLIRDTDGQIRIIGYNVNSDGFLGVK